jgi:phasin
MRCFEAQNIVLGSGDDVWQSSNSSWKSLSKIREVAEKTIDQAERGFSAFIEAANKSISMMPNPTTDMSLKALSLTEQNMRAAFDHAKKLLHAKDLQEAMQLQTEFLKAQYSAATERLNEMGGNMRSSSTDPAAKAVEIK